MPAEYYQAKSQERMGNRSQENRRLMLQPKTGHIQAWESRIRDAVVPGEERYLAGCTKSEASFFAAMSPTLISPATISASK